MRTLFALLIFFQIKHFLCDFPLQGKYMLGKFRPGWGFLAPLTVHCLVHASFTLALLWAFSHLDLWYLAVIDFVAHFTMDRIKAGPKYLGRFKDMYSPYFWWSLGVDQSVHHLTHYFIIWRMVS
jgi:hypothetical protein